jgi:hypothetical protein
VLGKKAILKPINQSLYNLTTFQRVCRMFYGWSNSKNIVVVAPHLDKNFLILIVSSVAVVVAYHYLVFRALLMFSLAILRTVTTSGNKLEKSLSNFRVHYPEVCAS